AVTLTYDGTALATASPITTNSSGSFTAAFTVPSSLPDLHIIQGTDNQGNHAPAAFTVTSFILLNPGSGHTGAAATIKITGSGFASSSAVTLTFNGTKITTNPSHITTNSSGVFAAIFSVPGLPAGTYSLTGIDASNNLGSAPFNVLPSISLNPSSGTNGTKVTVTGSGFAGSSAVTLAFDNATLSTSTIATDSSGSFTATFSVPVSIAGQHTVKATDFKNNAASATLGVIPQIRVNPSGGPAGQTVTVTGFDFSPLAPVTLTFNGTTIQTSPSAIATDSSGSFTATFSVPHITAGSYLIVATDPKNNVSFSAASVFTVTLAVSLTPATSHVGDEVTVGGSGFNSLSTVTLTYNGIPVGISSTNPSGAFTATITIPPSGIGSQHLVVSDASCNAVNSLITINPSLTLNPSTGLSGRLVTVTGSGFASSSAVTLTYDGTTLSTSPSTVTTGSSGSFTTVFTVPQSATGSHSVKATDSQNNGISAVYYIDNLPAYMSLKPGDGAANSTIAINGSSFLPSSKMKLSFNGTSNATTMTDSSGSFDNMFTIPPAPAGQYKINATNISGSILSTAVFSAGPSLSLNPTNSPAGDTVTVTGGGFGKSSQVTLTYDGIQLATVPSTITTDKSGSFTATFTVPATTTGQHTLVATDPANHITAAYTSVILKQYQVLVASGVLPLTLSASQPQLFVTNGGATLPPLTIPLGIDNATADLQNILNQTATASKVTLCKNLNINATTSRGVVSVQSPPNITISGPPTWNGTINLPQVVNNTQISLPPPPPNTVNKIIQQVEIGAGSIPLTVDKAVRLFFAGNADKDIAYSNSGPATEVTALCPADDQNIVDNFLGPGQACKISVGQDLIVWTKHLTVWTIFNPVPIVSSPSTPSSSSAPSQQSASQITSGGGGGGGGGGSGGAEYCAGSSCPAGTTALPGQLVQVPAITVSSDKPSYYQCDSITITGNVGNVQAGYPVTLRVYNPSGQLFNVAQTVPSAGGAYSYSLKNSCNAAVGAYGIMATYDSNSASSKFSIISEAATSQQPPPAPVAVPQSQPTQQPSPSLVVTPSQTAQQPPPAPVAVPQSQPTPQPSSQKATSTPNQPPFHLFIPSVPAYYLIVPPIMLAIVAIIAAASKRGRPEPAIVQVKIPKRIHLGNTFELAIKATNRGRTATQQTVCIEFPTLDSTNDLVASSDLQTRLVEKNGEIDSQSGIAKTAKYVTAEAVGSTWNYMEKHDIMIHARPRSAGEFTVLVKMIASQHGRHWYYPGEGARDDLGDFVNVYTVLVEETAVSEAEVVPKAEAKALEQKTRQPQMAPVVTAKVPIFEGLKSEYRLLLSEISKIRQDVITARKVVETRLRS
ncbi:MAG: hypothetical protein KGH88_08710, partial [Thaumarchaeota archaeon]|nr:hypothetical protein [Nitrososphaerota archaeon]